MKLIQFIDDYWRGIYFYNQADRDKRVIVDNWRAKAYCRETIDWDYYQRTGKKRIRRFGAIILKDLGLHFGRSKHFYRIGGRSKIWERKKMK